MVEELIIILSSNRKLISHDINLKGNNNYLGFRLKYNNKSNIIVNEIIKKSPTNKISKWKTEIRYYTLLSVENIKIILIQYLYTIIKNARILGNKKFCFNSVIIEKNQDL